ncbi:MAG: hypothetical protein IT437_07725 [Phycisphaerales bacterium]|nr:hypothetical protein [Phycisphaerales bacterium]
MSGALPTAWSLLRPARGPAGADRLWPALSRPVGREQPLTGFDVLGERVRGWSRHRRAGRADRRRAERIVGAAASLSKLSELELGTRIDAARSVAARDRDLAESIDAAFAVAHEVVRRQVGLSLYVEQVMAALAMADGCCAELATGEGKTVTAILPAALDAWSGRGVHVVTVNDYLAKRDAKTTEAAYRRLGLSVGVLEEDLEPHGRLRAYAGSITYGADKQFIFDFLRDRLAAPLHPRLAGLLLEGMSEPGGARWAGRIVQRGLHAAIVDEADSVLIDEATTPAIIGQDVPDAGGNGEHYRIAARLAAELEPGDYTVDRPLNRVTLTERGRGRLAERAATLPAFWAGPRRREELIVQAVGARELYRCGDEYIVRDGRVVIVDRSTGRVLEGRQWQLGVHQAVEAKEGLKLTEERHTTARISYHRYFQRYRRLSGMTGTAWEVRSELWRDYHLPVVRVPTHRPVIRKKVGDRVFGDEGAKFGAVAERVAACHASGRPVLVGTRSVASSERLGALLSERGVPCRVLNATREAEEAAIIAEAGRLGAVTVATNMAGRGTDILLDARSRELGGLVVISTERHAEPRVDRQLYGRSGRQGDPGRAEPFVSLDDAVILRFGIRPLRWLARVAGRPAAWVLWRQAQWAAGRQAAVVRSEIAKAEAWVDLAMHSHTR